MMYLASIFSLLLLPVVGYAAAPSFKQVVGNILVFNQLLVAAIFTITFLVVVWKIVDAWILKGGDPEAIKKGKKTLIIAVIVLVVMSGLWGILGLLISSFGTVIR